MAYPEVSERGGGMVLEGATFSLEKERESHCQLATGRQSKMSNVMFMHDLLGAAKCEYKN